MRYTIEINPGTENCVRWKDCRSVSHGIASGDSYDHVTATDRHPNFLRFTDSKGMKHTVGGVPYHIVEQ